MKQKRNKKTSNGRYLVCEELKPDVFPTHQDVKKILRIRDMMKKDRVQELQTVVIPFDVLIASDSSGNIQQTYANNPTNSPYWTEYDANWDEYRVLGIKVSYEPFILVGGSTITLRAPISVVTDYDDSTSLTAYSLADTYSDHERHPSDRPWEKVSCEAVTLDGWNGNMAAGPTNQFWVKLFSAGNSASTSMGRILVEYIVQFRGRGI